MKITDIRILGRNLPNFTLLEIETDEGITGIGGTDSHGPAVVAIIETGARCLKNLIMGEDPRDTGRLWRKMCQHWVAPSGPIINAMGAIDMALWDIVGKAAGVPIYKLLGGAVQQQVMAYASSTAFEVTPHIPNTPYRRQSPEAIVRQAGGYVKEGFKAIKIGWGNHFSTEDQEVLAAIRKAIGPDIRLMLDFGNPAFWTNGWNVNEAIKAAHICEKFGVYFLEEPLAPYDVEGHAALTSAVDINISSGEMLCLTSEFKQFIDRHAVDIIQPDAYRIGITQFVEVARMAEKAGILCVPHSPWSALAIAAHVNVQATVSNGIMIEYPGSGLFTDEGPVWGPTTRINLHELVEYPPKMEGGYLPLPDRPGLGLGGFVHDTIPRLEKLAASGTP